MRSILRQKPTVLSFVNLSVLPNLAELSSHTDKKENQIFLVYKEIQCVAVANLYMSNGKEALPYMWLCNCSILNILIYEENLISFFISAARREKFSRWGKGRASEQVLFYFFFLISFWLQKTKFINKWHLKKGTEFFAQRPIFMATCGKIILTRFGTTVAEGQINGYIPILKGSRQMHWYLYAN